MVNLSRYVIAKKLLTAATGFYIECGCGVDIIDADRETLTNACAALGAKVTSGRLAFRHQRCLRGFMTARVEDLTTKLNDVVERSKMLLEAKDHWMDRALCAEQERDNLVRAVEDTAGELGCAPDREAIFFAIARLKQERDEAYERLKPFAKIDPVEIAFSKSEKSFRIDYDASF